MERADRNWMASGVAKSRVLSASVWVAILIISGACTATPTAAPSTNIPISTAAGAATRAGAVATTAGTVSGQAVVATSAATRALTATPVALAAIINKGKAQITVEALNAEINRELEAKRSLGDPPPADLKAFRDTVLDALIQQALIMLAADTQKVVVTSQDVDSEIADDIKIAGGRDKWLAQIGADHMSEAEYRDGVRLALITNKMRDIVTAAIGPTAEQVHTRHILVNDLATATQILAQLKGGADFATLAAKLSLDVTTKQTGGDLGWFPRGQLLQKSVEDSAFSLPLNQYSAPIKSDLGYHIIETLEKVKDRPLDPYTRSRLAEQTFEVWLTSLVKAAQIQKIPAAS